ncbi:MAG: YcaO-like family protein [Romboutsia sp.]|nr:YcaO-like family protein [Romboutsia sp.]
MSKIYSVRKGKECSPDETISKVENILNNLGIKTVSEWNNALEHHHSLNLRIEGTNLFTNGKGTTKEYALASAYGEMMERVQTMSLFRFNLQYPEEVMNYGGYAYAPDEIKISVNDIDKDERKLLNVFNNKRMDKNMAEKLSLIENCQYIHKEKNEYIYFIPFLDIVNDDKVFFPIKMVDLINGSNGMCAGNTYDEALVQGLSEILERYSNKIIVQKRLTPPNISLEYIKENCDTAYKMITAIEEKGYDVVIKDCSLGKGYPVAAAIIKDKDKGRFFVKFGSQPNMDIAIERCLTETFQGRNLENINWFRDYFYSYDTKFETQNLSDILHSGDGFYPYEFFGEEESYSFKPWNYEEDDNVVLKDKLKNLIIETGFNLYIRDWSFLVVPAYQLISPGLSNLYEEFDERVQWHKMLIEAKESARKLGEITEDDFEKIKSFMEYNNYTNRFGILDFIGLPVDGNGKWNNLKKDYFLTLYYYNKKEYDKAYSISNGYVNTYNNIYTRCMRHYILLKYLKNSDEKIISQLKNLYNEKVVLYVDTMLNDKSKFKEYNVKCEDCNSCKEECYQKKINEIFKNIKTKYAESFRS